MSQKKHNHVRVLFEIRFQCPMARLKVETLKFVLKKTFFKIENGTAELHSLKDRPSFDSKTRQMESKSKGKQRESQKH